jgi:hypothetical protein
MLSRQCLGPFDALPQVIALRRDAAGLSEKSAEMTGAKANQARQRRERYGLGEMLLDIGNYLSLLPPGQTTAD